ncbi:MAG: Ig-like domain-containing protein, partial [Clostridiales bacterium]|nr:Ig-like domain-containing protein [Clostridiales bacterium]
GTVENCYYLTDTASGGGAAGALVKTQNEFASGEIAWLLQKGQPDYGIQVWGQSLKGSESIDSYPVLTDQLPKRVWQASFIKNGETIYVTYVNNGGTVTPSTDDEWYDADGKFFNVAPVTKDTAFGLRVYFGGATGNAVTATYGQTAKKNLDEWMAYENGSSVEGRFTYTITDKGGIADATIEDNILIIPDNVDVRSGGYTLQITAREKSPLIDTEVRSISALSVSDFGKDDVVLSVHVDIEKAEQQFFGITNVPDRVAYGDRFKLETIGGTGSGGVTWTVQMGSGIDGGELFKVDPDGNVEVNGVGEFRITAKKSGGNNYNDISDTITITANKAVQDALTIIDIPSSVTYGNQFTLKTEGGSSNSDVTWEIIDGKQFATIGKTTGTVQITGVGSVMVCATKAGDEYYEDISATFGFTVNKANQSPFTITDIPANITYEDKPFKLSAVGGSGDGAVTWEVTEGDKYVEVASDGTVTIIGACETVAITATKAGGDNYNDISDRIVFTVNKANQKPLSIVGMPGNVAYGDTLTLSASGGSSGLAVTWEVTGGEGIVELGKASGEFSIVGVGENVTITATMAGGDNYNDVSVSFSFDVHKANQAYFAIKDLDNAVTYGENVSFTLVADGGSGDGAVTWEITEGEGYVTLPEVAVGKTITVTVVGACERIVITAKKSGGDFYYEISDFIEFAVNKANQSAFSIKDIPGIVVYGDTFTLGTVGGADGLTVEWSIKYGDGVVNEGTKAGEFTVVGVGSFTIVAKKTDGNNNYYDISDEITLTAQKANQATLTITNLPDPDDEEYGSSFTLIAEGGSSGLDIEWSVDNDQYVGIDERTGLVTVKQAGDVAVTITAKRPGGDYYYDVTASFTFTPGRAHQGIINIEGLDKSVVYGDKLELYVEGGTGDGEVEWTVKAAKDGCVSVTRYDDSTRITVDIIGVCEWVEITATKSGGTNYFGISDTVKFEIHKANQAHLMIEELPESVVYGMGSFKLFAIGGSGGGDVVWSISECNERVKIAPDGTVTIVGAYEDGVTVTATKSGGDNYNDISAVVVFVVHKANQSYFTIDGVPAVVTYNDTFELAADGGSGDGEVKWEIADGDGFASLPEQATGETVTVTVTGVGYVTITATKSGDSNHNSVSASISFTVNKANQRGLAITGLPNGVKFGDIPFELTADGADESTGGYEWSVKNGGDCVAFVGRTDAKNAKIEIIGACELVTITVVKYGDQHYNDISAEISFAVGKTNQRAVTIKGLPPSVFYNGEDFELTAEGGDGTGSFEWSVTDGKGFVTLVPGDNDGKITVKIVGACSLVTITIVKHGDDDYNETSTIISFAVEKAIPNYSVPDGLKATYGDRLDDVALPQGWAWENGALSVGNAGVNSFKAIYTDDDVDNYVPVTVVLTVTVDKAMPEYTEPDGLTATYGDTLSDVKLPHGWAWREALTTSVGNAGEREFYAMFTPNDPDNYYTVTVVLTVTVEKATPEYVKPTGLTARYGDTLAAVALPRGWAWNDELTTKVGNAGERVFKATFTPSDTANYRTVSIELVITVEKIMPEYVEPTGLTAKYGDTLAAVALPDGWAWVDALTTKVGDVGERIFYATYTPDDAENYNTVTVALTITVEPAAKAPKGSDEQSSWWWIHLIVTIATVIIAILIIILVNRRKTDDEDKKPKIKK